MAEVRHGWLLRGSIDAYGAAAKMDSSTWVGIVITRAPNQKRSRGRLKFCLRALPKETRDFLEGFFFLLWVSTFCFGFSGSRPTLAAVMILHLP